MDSSELLEALKKEFADGIVETHEFRSEATAVVKKEKLMGVLAFLKDDPKMAFSLMADITCVDRLKMNKTPRFEVVYNLYSISETHRIRIKVRLDESEPTVSTATGLWEGANWLEREVWDMFGIKFEGHPNLKRLLMYEEFEGHALRKDYPHDKRQPLIGPKN